MIYETLDINKIFSSERATVWLNYEWTFCPDGNTPNAYKRAESKEDESIRQIDAED